MTQAGVITTSSFQTASIAAKNAHVVTQPVILHERWPALAAAIGEHHQKMAEEFSRQVYACVREGLISGSDRNRLARKAEELGLRSFDAQLIIACAIRQWSLDQPIHRKKAASQKRLITFSPIARSLWLKFAVIGALALAIDAAVIVLWLR